MEENKSVEELRAFDNFKTLLTDATNWTVLANTTVPVELESFNGIYNIDNEYVDLVWITNLERNADFFEVQRSVDGFNWHNIANIPAAGNSTKKSKYSAEDRNPIAGINLYRLRQVDLIGAHRIFNIISIDVRRSVDPIIYPNPVSTFLYLNPNLRMIQ